MEPEANERRQPEGLVVREFSLVISATFVRPVLKADAKIDEIINDLLQAEYLKGMLNPENILFIAADELLRYTLRIPLLDGLITLLLNAQGLTLTYVKGETSNNLINVISLFEKITAACMKNPPSQLQIVSGIHGTFPQLQGLEAFVEPFVDSSAAISAGGYNLSGEGRYFKGSIRLMLEPSLVFENSLFVQAMALTSEPWVGDLMARIRKRADEVLAARGLSLSFNEQTT